MWGNKNKPDFGLLSDLKVVHCSAAAAAPVSAQLLGDYGADVIWIENAATPDVWRFADGWKMERERANSRNLALNIPTEEGKEILLKLLAEADVFIEASKSGQYEKWGLTDEVMWEVNPRLIILHVTGFGLTGDEKYLGRPSYDAVAQAFGGYTYANSNPETPPYAAPYSGDYFTGVLGAVSILAALHNVERTGKGESIDLAQYEAMMRVSLYLEDWLTARKDVPPAGYPSVYAGTGSFKCADGKYVFTQVLGVKPIKAICKLTGLDHSYFEELGYSSIIPHGTEAGDRLIAAMEAYTATKSSTEIEEEMSAAGLPCTLIMTYRDLEKNSHVLKRDMIVEYENVKGQKLRMTNVVPKFKNNPGKLWSPCPGFGQHNEEILESIGYSPEDIQELYSREVIAHDPEFKFSLPLTR